MILFSLSPADAVWVGLGGVDPAAAAGGVGLRGRAVGARAPQQAHQGRPLLLLLPFGRQHQA